MTLVELNALSASRAETELRRCCGSARWAGLMAAERPFATDQDLCAAARRIWDGLVPADWLEAFAAHPPIGGRATSAWAAEEQADAAAATPDVRAGLAEGNRLYARTFGYTFLVCASGRSAVEMLTMLEERLMNTPEEELLIAAAEQRKITELRLKKLITS